MLTEPLAKKLVKAAVVNGHVSYLDFVPQHDLQVVCATMMNLHRLGWVEASCLLHSGNDNKKYEAAEILRPRDRAILAHNRGEFDLNRC
jgi:hypothetical protein